MTAIRPGRPGGWIPGTSRKTHAGYHSRQSGPGRYLWTTPNGLAFLVDAKGTRPIDPAQARAILDVGPHTEIYFAPFDVVIDLEPN